MPIISRYRMRTIIAPLICLGLGMLSGIKLDVGPNSWYAQLQKPLFNPPNWIFGPVWTILYILLGLAWIKIREMRFKTWPSILFIAQFILNALWSPLFFHAHAIGWALCTLALLWLFTTLLLWCVRKKRPALFLLLPYWLWISFAMLINIHIYRLNP